MLSGFCRVSLVMKAIHVSRDRAILRPDQSRVLLRPFSPGDDGRVRGILARIQSIPEERVSTLLRGIRAEFGMRHQHIDQLFLARFEELRQCLPAGEEVPENRQLLIGSCFFAEYSLESA